MERYPDSKRSESDIFLDRLTVVNFLVNNLRFLILLHIFLNDVPPIRRGVDNKLVV